MTWNYRVIRKVDNDEIYYQIHEVYYREDGTPKMVTIKPIEPVGDTPEELLSNLKLQLAAFKKEPLDYSIFNNSG